jgi:hypothetical protein
MIVKAKIDSEIRTLIDMQRWPNLEEHIRQGGGNRYIMSLASVPSDPNPLSNTGLFTVRYHRQLKIEQLKDEQI